MQIVFRLRKRKKDKMNFADGVKHVLLEKSLHRERVKEKSADK